MSSPSFPGMFSWVMLRKNIPIFEADKKSPEALFMANASKDWADIKDGSLILEQFSLDAHLVKPPELSTLFLRAKLELLQRGIFCILDSVVENFIYMTMRIEDSVYGLVYDAAKNSLSLLPTAMEDFGRDFVLTDPPVPFEFLRQPAVLQRDDGSYDLLNLGLLFDDFCHGDQVLQPSGILFRWSSAVTKWTKQDARFNSQTLLPLGHPKRSMYVADVVFTFKGKIFWADLLLGAIVCDTLSTGAGDEDHVELAFIHLPEECKGQALEEEGYYRHTFEDAYPKERRTMGRVGDYIKLISIVTTNGDTPDDRTHPRDVLLRSGTLGPDFCSWTRDDDMELPLPLLWESDAYKHEMLPEAVPLNPVLKSDEDGVLYLLLGDYHGYWRRQGRLCREMECIISIDMRRKALLSCSRDPITDDLLPPLEVQPSKQFSPVMPGLFGVKFCAHHTEWSDGLRQKEKSTLLT